MKALFCGAVIIYSIWDNKFGHTKLNLLLQSGKKLTVKTGNPILAASFSFWESTILFDPKLKEKPFRNIDHLPQLC